MAGEGGEAVEEFILGAKNDRGTHDHRVGECLARRFFAEPLARDIRRGGVRVGADPRNMHIGRHARGQYGSGQRKGALDMHGRICLRPALRLHPRGVDDRGRAFDRRGDRTRGSEGWPAPAGFAPRPRSAAGTRQGRGAARPPGCAIPGGPAPAQYSVRGIPTRRTPSPNGWLPWRLRSSRSSLKGAPLV